MSTYIQPIMSACLFFPILAFFITIPYLIYEYRKFGSVLLFRTIIVYSFVLYLLICYFLVILPLPERALVAHYTSPQWQLEFGRFIKDILATTSLKWNELGSYLSFFRSSTVYTVLFNFVLTIPFGVYLRYYYQKKWYQVLLLTFCLSLFFELTQLTGLYGYYPRSYRLFDVDDLFINTLGGFFGFLLAPLVMRFLPTRDSLDQKAFQKGKKVSLMRRGFAYFIDCVFLIFIVGFCSYFFPQLESRNFSFGYYCISAGILFLLFPVLFEGRTIGKFVLKLRLVNEKGDVPKWYQSFFRYLLLHFVITPTPYYLILFQHLPFPTLWKQVICVILGINYLLFLIQFFLIACGKRKLFGYERSSHTQNESTIVGEGTPLDSETLDE